jgi:hypothetical protein
MKRSTKVAMGALGITLLLAGAQKTRANTVLVVMDGTDELNVEHGSPTPGHSPTVQYAFTFGPIAVQNSADAGASPSGPNTDFNYTGGTSSGQPNGAIGFGINNVVGAIGDYIELNVSANADNTQATLTGDIKEADGDEFQYHIPLPAAGSSGIVDVPLSSPSYNNGAGDNIPEDSPITQIQLQYPYSGAGTSTGVLDVTVHDLQIVAIPEPTSLGLLAVSSILGLSRRRR